MEEVAPVTFFKLVTASSEDNLDAEKLLERGQTDVIAVVCEEAKDN